MSQLAQIRVETLRIGNDDDVMPRSYVRPADGRHEVPLLLDCELPALMLANSPFELWASLKEIFARAGSPDICFVTFAGGGSYPEVAATTFAPHFNLDVMRQDLARSGSAIEIDSETIALPCFGPQGLEAALAIVVDLARSTDSEWARRLSMVFQLAYSRYRQISPIDRGCSPALSEREREITQWVMRGKSNAVIADILGISASTVDTYMRRIFKKLDVADRTSAVLRAVAIGAVS